MRDRLDKLEIKIDTLTEKSSNQDVHLERLTVVLEENTKDIKYHIKRTDLLEDHVHRFEQVFEKHLNFVRGAFWAITALFGLVITIAGLLFKFTV